MPRIFDNIQQKLLPILLETLKISNRADFCVGFFNLRGWRLIDEPISIWKGKDESHCRVLVGMHRLPSEDLRLAFQINNSDLELDNKTAIEFKKQMAQQFRDQLIMGLPTNEDEQGLRRLSSQLKKGKVIVKLFLRFPLHAKLYLLHRNDPNNPCMGIVGSSNLTMPGLSQQGELNVDVLDHDACAKLQKWFEDRWNDRWCLDITKELADIIDQSWAREDLIPPYHIYLKMAYHLSQEARAGLAEFSIPGEFKDILFEFQSAAVRIAAHHVNKRGGVLIGDVVGLGKTLVGTALAKIFQDDMSAETLILCPKNLVPMWEDYKANYRLIAHVLPFSMSIRELPDLRRYRYVLIDESHNLRNRESKTFRAIQEYIRKNNSRVVLLTATPYNKTYLDLSNQLRLFIDEDKDIGIRPEKCLSELGELEFQKRHQCGLRTLAAFEKSEHRDDWRELMRLFLVRRTRSFIMDNYADTDPDSGKKYLTFHDGARSYFPTRKPRTMKFAINDKNPDDQYARLYSQEIVDIINGLALPRYGLGNYIAATPKSPPTPDQASIINDLSRAGRRLKGFCRTNLFKRLESSGQSFLLSLQRHILRNHVFLYAIENNLPIPIGTQDVGILDSRLNDADAETLSDLFGGDDSKDGERIPDGDNSQKDDIKSQARYIYNQYDARYHNRFKWLDSSFFTRSLAKDLGEDADVLMDILKRFGEWEPDHDTKLRALYDLLTQKHPCEKVLVFSQFADTVEYLEKQMAEMQVGNLKGVTGDSENPTEVCWRFSPESNNRKNAIPAERELRIVIATDILSEGQNLQDCFIVVNYDLPWAIIRLIQRVGRVDRIGQKADIIHCYSFLPAEGVERIINLRGRVRQRLHDNAEVVGSDEAFFEDDRDNQAIVNLYNEKAGIFDDDKDDDVDLSSYAFQIWRNATKDNPSLAGTIEEMPDVVFSARTHEPSTAQPPGVLVYVRTSEDNDALAWIDEKGNSISESQFAILKAAACDPKTPALPHHSRHHELVRHGVIHIAEEEKIVGGGLGSARGARFKTYERLMRFVKKNEGTFFVTPELLRAIDDIYRFPLREGAKETLNRQMKSDIDDIKLAELVILLREENRLSVTEEEAKSQEPRIICSMGLRRKDEG
jgi:superfamily II DNA or RNA helicase